MSEKQLAAIQHAEDLLSDFLNRSGEPNETLVLDALTILTTLTYEHEIAQKKLEQERIEASWAANPDRMGGQFTQEEIARHSGHWI